MGPRLNNPFKYLTFFVSSRAVIVDENRLQDFPSVAEFHGSPHNPIISNDTAKTSVHVNKLNETRNKTQRTEHSLFLFFLFFFLQLSDFRWLAGETVWW